MLRRTFVTAGSSLLAACALGGEADVEDGSVPIAFDNEGRPVGQVLLNGRGLFSMVIDTAGQRAGLGSGLVNELGIRPMNGQAMLHGSSGAHAISLYMLDSVAFAGHEREQLVATALLHRNTSTAAGILGADFFEGRTVIFDFARARLSVGKPIPTAWHSHNARLLHGVFAVTPIQIGGLEVQAVIDTGAKASLGDMSLLAALGLAAGDIRPGETISGVAGGAVATQVARVHVSSTSGPASQIDLAFGAFPVFEALGLADRPAIILGNDLLRAWGGVGIDYTNSRVAFPLG